MIRWVRNLLILVAFGAILLTIILLLRPVAERFLFLAFNSPFNTIAESLKSDPSESVRGQAAITLATIDRPASVLPLIEALRHDPAIRADVERALILAGRPALPPLLDILKNYDNLSSNEEGFSLLESTARIVGEISAAEGKDIWINLIRDREISNQIRLTATELLGEADTKALEAVADYLDTSEMRIAAIKAVGASQDVDLVRFLMTRFLHDQDEKVRKETLIAVGELLREEGEQGVPSTEGTPTIVAVPTFAVPITLTTPLAPTATSVP